MPNAFSPWTVVNDYTKTVVTVASAFLAFTVTFYSQISDNGPRWLLLLTWAMLVAAVAAALYSAGRLTSHLQSSRISVNPALLFANIAYFALFLGVASFFVYALLGTRENDRNSESQRAVDTATRYVAVIDSAYSRNLRVRHVAWDSGTDRWLIQVVSGKDSVGITVNSRGVVEDYRVLR